MTPVIYEPKGRAKEYSELALNIFDGCLHNCLYCWVPLMPGRSKKFHEKVEVRKDILFNIERDCKKLEGDKRQILLCFTCDPYPIVGSEVTREALLMLEKYKMQATILTKSGERSMRDFDILKRNGWSYGTSLCSLNAEFLKQYEPNAAPPEERMDALVEAQSLGIKTWVSVEPVLDPIEAIDLVDAYSTFVDHWKIGKLNHSRGDEKLKAIEEGTDWAQFLEDVKHILDLHDCDYYIKKDLARFGEEE